MDTLTQENTVLSQTGPILPEKPKQNNFLVILLSVLLLISISIAGFFTYQTQKLVKELSLLKSSPTPVSSSEPTPDLTADWKTYINSDYGITFKYPQNGTYKITNYTGSKFSVTFSNLTTYDYTDLTVFVGDKWAFTNPKADSVKNFTIDGLEGYKEDLPMGQNPPQTMIYIKNKNDHLTIQLTKNDKDTEIDGIFNQILSTFKFTESDLTADWKTYTNIKCKYSVKYPPTWNLYPENEDAIFGVASITSYDDNNIPKPPNLLKIQIGCGELNGNQSANEWMENRKTLDDGYSVPEFSLLNGVRVDNKLTFKYRVNPSIGDDVLNYFIFPNNGKVVSLAFTPFESALNSYIDQILSSFKFTN